VPTTGVAGVYVRTGAWYTGAECTTGAERRGCDAFGVTFGGALYGSGGGASGVVEVGVVGGGVLSARADDTQHTAANTTKVATAGARALDVGMAASPYPPAARAGPAAASCDAVTRVNFPLTAAFR